MNSFLPQRLRLATLMAAFGLVGETIGLGSQSLRKTITDGEQHALQMALRTGARRGSPWVKAPRDGRPVGKLARMAAKGALGSSGRSSRTRIAVAGSYDAPYKTKHGGQAMWHKGKYNPGFLLNCATADRG